MDALYKFVLFKIDSHHFALDINSIDRISKLVEITPLPNAPTVVIGIINVQGDVMPVVDIRKRLKLPAKDFELSDHLIVGHTAKRSLALLVDDIGELIEIQPKRLTKQGDILPGLGPISGVIKLQGDVILIQDMETFFSLEEERMIDAAIQESQTKPAPAPVENEFVKPEEKIEIQNEEIKPKKKTVKKEVKPVKQAIKKKPSKAKKVEPKKAVKKVSDKKTTKTTTKTKATQAKTKK